MLYEVFIYCGDKCGSSTLNSTFVNNNYNIIKIHNNNNYKLLHKRKEQSIFELIDSSLSVFENVYIIDSYRDPIERKISSFFENITRLLPNYESLTLEEIIIFFNNNMLNLIEEYHSINEVFQYYNIKPFINFDLKKRYNIVKLSNKILIKLLFKDIGNWDKILSEIFQKEIVMYTNNLTKNKSYNNLYENLKKNYMVPKSYLENILINDIEFKIYNNKEEQEKYIEKWLEKSF